MQITENIVKNIISIERHIKEYELIHTYFGPPEILKEAKKIKIKDAYGYLLGMRGKLKNIIPDEFPHFRRTYYEDLIGSVLAQIEIFVFSKNKKHKIKDAVEAFFAVKLPPLFKLEAERIKMFAGLKDAGYLSLRQFRESMSPLSFKGTPDFKRFMDKEIKRSFEMIKNGFGKYFDADLKDVFSKSKVSVEIPGKNMPPCYYYYKGGYAGATAVDFKNKLTDVYIKSFVAHEISPGHHFYYLIRENMYRNKKTDIAAALDTFYAPETIINEGLAMSVDVLFEDILEKGVKIKGLAEKYFHRVLYNIWYSHFILKKSYKKYTSALFKDFQLKKDEVKFWTDYYLGNDWKYYAVSYAIGSYYVDRFLKIHGIKNARYVYGQQSVNTLKKLEKELGDGKKHRFI